MKKKLLNVVKVVLLAIATVSANCPSQFTFYEPQVPEKLKK